MTAFQIYGGIPLQGKVKIQGSKNAALPVLAATLLTGDECVICNCPQIIDVQHMASILTSLGCKVRRREDGYLIDSTQAYCCGMEGEAITGMRSSLCLLGAMLGRFGEVVMEHPGGCVIGSRPIDLHLKALREMGVCFTETDGKLTGRVKRLHGARIHLAFPSVGATENVLLAAVLAEGNTELVGAAREPEIITLCEFLTACGAQIEGTGTSVLQIRGVERLHGVRFRIPADRIVAGTYLFACTGCGGNVFLEEAPWGQMEAVIHVAECMGARCQVSGGRTECRGYDGKDKCHCGCSLEPENGLYVQGPDRPWAIDRLRTAVYPGFPTDLQSMALAVLTIASGKSMVEETIFENRFRVLAPLRSMWADIELCTPEIAVVRGVPALHGARVEAQELRGGAALVIAGLMAEGKSEITGCGYIGRGYENICKDLRDLGARIVSV
ncbi:MAG: UDP-N-acetylglucosamine 1-carboxyvinyltransferase [Lachnospiraceae bacterium]|nr:UDP-N-acetylglucosamine 1-carboxyvinyltransferase [Lachnospiraceae bacterium]